MDKLSKVPSNTGLASFIDALPSLFQAVSHAVSRIDEQLQRQNDEPRSSQPEPRNDPITQSIADQGHRISRFTRTTVTTTTKTTIYYE